MKKDNKENLKNRISSADLVEQVEKEKKIYEKLGNLNFGKENKLPKESKNLYLAKDTLAILEKYGGETGWGVSKIISLILRDWLER